jgi:hypothetical protein
MVYSLTCLQIKAPCQGILLCTTQLVRADVDVKAAIPDMPHSNVAGLQDCKTRVQQQVTTVPLTTASVHAASGSFKRMSFDMCWQPARGS